MSIDFDEEESGTMGNCDGRKISENEIAEEFQRRKEMAKGPSK